MSGLRRDDGFGGRGDEVYELLVAAHRGLSDEQSAALATRLVLLLANQVGDPDVVAEAIAAARTSLGLDAQPSTRSGP
ncbi:MAG: DUF2783 domain-containing protein [Proteobacteria bacterium]|nr:DUF2783 domain-containing protein [Pseudomonadota bacterium]